MMIIGDSYQVFETLLNKNLVCTLPRHLHINFIVSTNYTTRLSNIGLAELTPH